MMITPTAFCLASINLYRNCGFTCPDTVEVVISNGQLLSYPPIDLIDDPCYNDNNELSVNIYSFMNNGQATGNINYTIADTGTIDNIIIKNEITGDPCMISMVIVDDQSACTDFEYSQVSNLYLTEVSNIFVLYPEDVLIASCPNRNYKIQEQGGLLMDSIVMDINTSNTYTINIVDPVTNNSCWTPSIRVCEQIHLSV
ncbi:MAG: hypothetical protein ACI86M_001852 [Saprospiraceae bacterium]|jgi:hypothetical protein